MLLLTLSCSVELVRHCEKCRKSSIFIVKFSTGSCHLHNAGYVLSAQHPGSMDQGSNLIYGISLRKKDDTGILPCHSPRFQLIMVRLLLFCTKDVQRYNTLSPMKGNFKTILYQNNHGLRSLQSRAS